MEHKIRVFGTPTCPYCHTIKMFLDKYGLKYEDVDVSSDDQALKEMMEGSGQKGVPVVEIDGEFIVGFEKDRMSELLNIKE